MRSACGAKAHRKHIPNVSQAHRKRNGIASKPQSNRKRSIKVGGGSGREARARAAVNCEEAVVVFFHSPALRFVSGESVRSIRVRGRFREGSGGTCGWQLQRSRCCFFHSPALPFFAGENVRSIRTQRRAREASSGARGSEI